MRRTIATIGLEIRVAFFALDAGVVAIAEELIFSGIVEGTLIDGIILSGELLIEQGTIWLSEFTTAVDLIVTGVVDQLFVSRLGRKALNYILNVKKISKYALVWELGLDLYKREYQEFWRYND